MIFLIDEGIFVLDEANHSDDKIDTLERTNVSLSKLHSVANFDDNIK